MRILTLLGLAATFAVPQQPAAPRPAGCDPVGNVQFICGAIGPEDLVTVPGGEWVIASGDAAGGAIQLISVRDRTVTPLSPRSTLSIMATGNRSKYSSWMLAINSPP